MPKVDPTGVKVGQRIVLWYGYILWMSGLFIVGEMCSDREMSRIEHVWDTTWEERSESVALHSTLLNLRQLLLEEWI